VFVIEFEKIAYPTGIGEEVPGRADQIAFDPCAEVRHSLE
jgi:hypothetical protein